MKRWGISRACRLAVWFALIASGGEILIRILRASVIDQLGEGYHPEMFWLVPLSNALVFMVAALCACVAMVWASPVTRDRMICFLLGAMAAFGIGVLFPRIHIAAIALVALGVGMRLARVLGEREGLERMIARSSLLMAGVLAVPILVAGPVEHRRSAASLADLAPPRDAAPNVLLLILDTVRAKSLSIYVDSLDTAPRLAAFARRGVVFDRAIAPTSWTLPSHASMFSGRAPHELSADWQVPLDDTTPVVAEAFTAAGYATGGFVANRIAAGPNSGLSRGFSTYRVDDFSLGRVLMGASFSRWLLLSPRLKFTGLYGVVLMKKDGRHVNQQFLRWLDGIGGRPFFGFLNYMDAHEPYWPPAQFAAMKNGRRIPGMVHHEAGTNPEKAAEALAAYHGAIRYLDTVISELLDELERRGTLRNTVVVLAADHGEAFALHGVMTHGNALYMQQLHVPLIIVHPDAVPAGRRVSDVTILTDVASTLLGLAGLQQATIPGRSLARYWEAGKPDTVAVPAFASLRYRPRPEESWPIAQGPMAAVVTDSLYLIRRGDATYEMYRYRTDEREVQNLSGRPETAGDERLLRELLDKTIPQPAATTRPPVSARDAGRANQSRLARRR